ncbi:MAG: ParB/RepB/Spo0J family partition protein [Bowdeniella nasicola]|nr:ParB/RepB/Spo0J family partition protein [Bowdeniella nasicola]
MAEKRRGLGRGIDALIPKERTSERPSDIFFPQHVSRETSQHGTDTATSSEQQTTERQARVAHKRATRANGAGTKRTPPVRGSVRTASTDEDLRPIPGLSVAELPVDAIAPNSKQPRTIFDDEELEELAASIAEVGLLQPIVVRPATDADMPEYELVMGERRWRASQLAQKETIPAIIRHTDDNDLLRDALLENLHRVDLNPLEEASAYRQLLEDFGCTQDELARRIARSRPQISNTLRLLKLPPLVQRRVAAGVLSAGHARALLGLDDAAAMERLAQRIVAEGLSVRATEEIIALGDEPMAPEMRRRKLPQPENPQLQELAAHLADRFDTKVKVAMGQRKGRITVEFAGMDDLARIMQVLAPDEAKLLDDNPS